MNSRCLLIVACLAFSFHECRVAGAAEVKSHPFDVREHVVWQLNIGGKPVGLPAEIRLVTEAWNVEEAKMPYLAYMPEKDRVLMMLSVHRKTALIHSDDRGTTWSERRWLHVGDDGRPNARPGGLTYLGQGKLVAAEGNVLWSSSDFGKTWTSRGIQPTSELHGEWDPFLVLKDAKGRATRLARASYEETGVPWGSAERPFSWAYFQSSVDEGQTWGEPIKVPSWRGVGEVAMIVAPNGDWVAACRTDCPTRLSSVAIGRRQPGKEDFNHDRDDHAKAHFATFGRRAGTAHWDHYCGLAISRSQDQGRTWSELTTLYEWGRHHPSLALLSNGRILMSYVVRLGYPDTADGFPEFGVEAVLSTDNGRTWDLDHRYVLAKWVGNIQGENAYHCGVQSTSTVVLPDGRLLTAFGTGVRSIPDARRQQDVALVRWRVDAP